MAKYRDAPSIMQKDKVCFLSGSTVALEAHHIFFGNGKRELSARYGLWVWLRHDLHNEPPAGVHFNRENNRMLQALAQTVFEQTYPDLDFIKIFGRNYKS